MLCPTCSALLPDGVNICPTCGSPVSPQVLPVGTVLQNKYRLDGVLGQGGFGITYAATQTQIGSRLAIKELFPDGTVRLGKTIQPPASLGAEGWEQTKRNFSDEARTLARFSEPDIVRVQDYFEENGTSYMVMERLAGESLQQRLDRVGKLPPAEVEKIAAHVAQALTTVHRAGLLHRDIKPANIYLEASGRVVLVDFGSAREFVSGKTTSYTRLVSPGYAPLEQYGSVARFGPYSDIYALGATLYHALSGAMPPAATDLVQGVELPALPASAPAPLRAVIERAMSPRVAERPQDAPALLQMLTVAPSLPVTTAPSASVPLPAPTQSTERRVGFPWMVVALIGPLALGGTWLFKNTVEHAIPRPATVQPPAKQASDQPTRVSKPLITNDPLATDQGDYVLKFRAVKVKASIPAFNSGNLFEFTVFNRSFDQNGGCLERVRIDLPSGELGGFDSKICVPQGESRSYTLSLWADFIKSHNPVPFTYRISRTTSPTETPASGTISVPRNTSPDVGMISEIKLYKVAPDNYELSWQAADGAKNYWIGMCSAEHVGLCAWDLHTDTFRQTNFVFDPRLVKSRIGLTGSDDFRVIVAASNSDWSKQSYLNAPNSQLIRSLTYTKRLTLDNLANTQGQNISCRDLCPDLSASERRTAP